MLHGDWTGNCFESPQTLWEQIQSKKSYKFTSTWVVSLENGLTCTKTVTLLRGIITDKLAITFCPPHFWEKLTLVSVWQVNIQS